MIRMNRRAVLMRCWPPNQSVHRCLCGFVGSAVTFLCACVWTSNLALCPCVYQGVLWLPFSINHCQILVVQNKPLTRSMDNGVVGVCAHTFVSIKPTTLQLPISFTHSLWKFIECEMSFFFPSDEYCKKAPGDKTLPGFLRKEGRMAVGRRWKEKGEGMRLIAGVWRNKILCALLRRVW